MLGSGTGYGLNQQATPAVEKQTIHAGLSSINSRLYDLSVIAEHMILRLYGPRPADSPEQQGKDAREPSTSEHVTMAHAQLSRLEDRLQQIAAFIG